MVARRGDEGADDREHTSKSLTRYFDVGPHQMATDHERDAALGALGAWAMIHRTGGWSELRVRDPDAVSPLAEPLGYWMPTRE